MPVLVANRLADLAIGPSVVADPALPVVSEPIFKYRLVVVAAGNSRPLGAPRQWRWLVDPSATDPGSDVGQVLAALRIPEDRIGVCSSQTAAWAAAADGGGVSLAVEHLVAQQLRRRRALAGRRAGCAGRGLLVRHDARTPAAQHRGQFAAAVPEHARGHAADASAGGGRSAIPVQAARVRDDLELTTRRRAGAAVTAVV